MIQRTSQARQRPKPASTHIELWTAGPLLTDQGSELLPTPPPRVLEAVDGPKGSAEEVEKVLPRTACGVFFLTRIGGSALIWAPLVKGPHESGATSFPIEAVFVDAAR